jgi:hypothetical protein
MPPRLSFAVLLLLVASCNAVVDLEHLTGGEFRTDDVTMEAGVDGALPLAEAGAEAGAEPGLASGADVTDGGGDGSTSLCAGAGLIFCDDFEGRSATLGPWSAVDGNSATAALVLGTPAGGSSAALLASSPGGAQAVEVLVKKDVPYSMVVANKVTLEFDYQFAANRAGFGPSQSADHVNLFYFETSTDDYDGFIEVARNECAFLVNDVHYEAPQLCSGTKVHVTYEVNFAASSGRVRIGVGGVSVADATGVTISPPSTFSFGFGLALKGTYPAMAAAVDNVTVR